MPLGVPGGRDSTREQRAVKYRNKNSVRRKRYRLDPAYREHLLAKKQRWKEAKEKKFPQYKKLATLRSTQHRLRGSIEHHQNLIEKFERKLIAVTREIAKLRAECMEKHHSPSIK